MGTPATIWKNLKEGNQRFVSGTSEHPNQCFNHRLSLVDGQSPPAVIFGCSDSRLAAEIIFDQGLGDMFVVRTAGHVLDSSVLGSIEYAVQVLNSQLIVILGHDACGAVQATINAVDNGDIPSGFVRDVVQKVSPSIFLARRENLTTVDDFEDYHVIETVRMLLDRSSLISERILKGNLALIGTTYGLEDGRVRFLTAIGNVGDTSDFPAYQ